MQNIFRREVQCVSNHHSSHASTVDEHCWVMRWVVCWFVTSFNSGWWQLLLCQQW